MTAVARTSLIVHDRTILSSRQRGSYIRTITASVQLENKITGRESQGARRPDDLIGGKSPIVR
jgi:hypothetical protein